MNTVKTPLTSAILASACVGLISLPNAAEAGHAQRSSNKVSKSTQQSAKKLRLAKAPRRTGGGCQTLPATHLAAKAAPYQATISKAAQQYDVNPSLVKAVITIESCFKPNARGSSGEKGLMQLMPGTARRFNIRDGYSTWQNIHGGSRYLSHLLDRYDGNTNRAIAAYNAGEGNVSPGGRIPNMVYVNKVLTALQKFAHPFSDVPTVTAATRELAPTPSNKTLKSTPVALKAASSTDALKAKVIPASMKTVMNTGADFSKPATKTPWNPKARTYTVQAGDTVFAIMRQTGVSVTKLVALNDLPAPYGVNVGQVLRLR